MSWVRNLLISIGAFWLSRQLVVLSSLTLGRVANGVIYGGSLLSAIAFGFMESLGRSACAALGAAIVTLAASGEKPERWAGVVALLYVFFAAPRVHYHLAPTTWDRVAQVSDILWPAVFCIATALLIARIRRQQLSAGTSST